MKKKAGLLEGFKVFLLRGNVIDLAIAVVIGAAFTNIVNAFVKGVINPLVGAIGTKDLESYSSCLKSPCVTDPKTGEATEGIRILCFVITAAAIYFLMVLPMAKYLARRAAMQAAKDGVQETLEVSELEVLKEIRDVLVSQRSGPAGEGRGQEPGRGHDE
ncbi:large conductance mechanosensitive channel protein MscL [Streptomyces sp. NBC_01763]|uniref:large conductance mechanosensitive channel protein MscL n=1 Tax=Streptomyces sp. NBC_01763 TaxID=2975934 RepID=UPI002DDC7A8D|nr:large conductance mechanosensitive channel protein MscL [Streptomyces sp. NBC_01763]WSC37514.1 large conductance mechanosensitive channel protein MscL [Streptomyces sp. NBC_01763]